METVQTPTRDLLSSDVINHILSEKEILELMVRVCFPPQDLEIISTKDQDRDNTPLPPPLPGFLWAGVKEENTKQPVTLSSIEEVTKDEILLTLPSSLLVEEEVVQPITLSLIEREPENEKRPTHSSSSLPAVEWIKPRPNFGSYVGITNVLLPILLFLGIIGITVLPWISSPKEINTGIVQTYESSKLFSECEPETEQISVTEDQTEKTEQQVFFYTLQTEDDYPSALAWACGFNGKDGREALREIQELNPYIDWKHMKVFHEGDRFRTPCPLTPQLVKKALHEIHRYHKQRRIKINNPNNN